METVKKISYRYPFLLIFVGQLLIFLLPSVYVLAAVAIFFLSVFLLKLIKPVALILSILVIFLFYQLNNGTIAPVKWHYGSITGKVQTFSSEKNNVYSFVLKSGKLKYWVKSQKPAFYSDTVTITGRFHPLKSSCSFMGFDFSNFLRSKKISSYVSADKIVVIHKGVFSSIDRLRENISEKFKTWLNNPEVASSLVLGRQPTSKTYLRYQEAGVGHILAVSGIHLAFFLLFFGFILKIIIYNLPFIYQRFDASRIIALILLFAALFFVYFTGLRVSTVRAFLMIAVYLFSIILRKRFDSFNALFAAACLIGLIMPSDFLTAGFILSFAGTGAAIILYKLITIKNKLHKTIIFYIAIFIMLLPIQIHYFGIITPFAPLSNFIILPFVEFMIIPGLQILSFIFIAAPHSYIILPFSSLINSLFTVLSALINDFDKLPFFITPLFNWTIAAMIYLLAALLIIRKRRYLPFALIVAVILVLSIIRDLSPHLYIEAGKRNSSILAVSGKTGWLIAGKRNYTINNLVKKDGIRNLVTKISEASTIAYPFSSRHEKNRIIISFKDTHITVQKGLIIIPGKQIKTPAKLLIRFIPFFNVNICK